MSKTIRKFVDYDGLSLYDSLSKKRTKDEISIVATYELQPGYVKAHGTALEGVTYYRLMPGTTPTYRALPYTDPETGITYPAPNIGDPVDDLYISKEVDTLISGVVKEYVDAKFRNTLEGTVIYYPVYYIMERDPETGELKPVMTHELTTDKKAVEGKDYYERSGAGTTESPFVYTKVEVIPGVTDVSNFYEYKQLSTIHPEDWKETEYELEPAIDPETGEQILQPITYVDNSTTTTVINTLADTATIEDSEIIDLFEKVGE